MWCCGRYANCRSRRLDDVVSDLSTRPGATSIWRFFHLRTRTPTKRRLNRGRFGFLAACDVSTTIRSAHCDSVFSGFVWPDDGTLVRSFSTVHHEFNTPPRSVVRATRTAATARRRDLADVWLVTRVSFSNLDRSIIGRSDFRVVPPDGRRTTLSAAGRFSIGMSGHCCGGLRPWSAAYTRRDRRVCVRDFPFWR